LRFFDHRYREQVTLADGARLVLRALGPCDARLLSCHFTALSAESRWGRFLGAKSELSAADLRHFTHIDGERHFAVVALCADKPHLAAGVARFIMMMIAEATIALDGVLEPTLLSAAVAGR
jgi:hypothetical protein